MENQLSREGGLDSHYGEPIIKRVRAGFPLTDFTQPHVCAYPTPGPRYLRPYVIGFFCVQWIETRGGLLFILLILVELWTITAWKQNISFRRNMSGQRATCIYLWMFLLQIIIFQVALES
jgi:hypothetical protein